MTDTHSSSSVGATASPQHRDERRIGEFLASHGGPFYQLQVQLKLLKENSLRAAPRAALFVALAWGKHAQS
ncbi:hypothetical protein [Rhizobium sullae]|uniref:Uncharacterized protein n=1 Tax=Rhizobium sullae TaxID=50338 RepID=A0A2N0CYE3_RHISU|nr:hypothetical protein [Rhizobium sullae]PKA38857.1 hypothetical protein CWR43_36005 [Rhizobium sullae]UWU16865.1 hypothetical protein N2599_29010 [Rhizobium sullae]